MQVIKSENIKPFDVDGTLVLPNDNDTKGDYIEVLDPVTNTFILMKIHKPNVRLLREELQRGAQVIVWSRSGWEWAQNVLKALDFGDSCNIIVMSKPIAYFDDMPVEQWLKDRIYLDPNLPYKQ